MSEHPGNDLSRPTLPFPCDHSQLDKYLSWLGMPLEVFIGDKWHPGQDLVKEYGCDFLLTSVTPLVTVLAMIKSFIHKGLEDFFSDGTRKGIQAKHASKLVAILDRLDAAHEIKDMNYPGSDLHLLLPKAKGRWSIKVSGNWRLTFEFKNGDALNVDIEDYH